MQQLALFVIPKVKHDDDGSSRSDNSDDTRASTYKKKIPIAKFGLVNLPYINPNAHYKGVSNSYNASIGLVSASIALVPASMRNLPYINPNAHYRGVSNSYTASMEKIRALSMPRIETNTFIVQWLSICSTRKYTSEVERSGSFSLGREAIAFQDGQ